MAKENTSDQKKSEQETSTPNIPDFVGNPWDCPTISIDGLAGMALSPHQTKITLAEHYPIQGRLVGKHVATLVIANDQFLKVADAFADVAKRMRQELGEDKEDVR